MSRQQALSSEELFAILDEHDSPQLDDTATILAVLDYIASVIDSEITLQAGSQEHRRATRAYNALLNAVIHRLDDVTNMGYATGHRTASRAFEYAIIVADRPARTPWLRQLSCIRHLAETGFSVLPDRFVRIHTTFHPGRSHEIRVTDVIRLSEDDMATDDEKAAFNRLVAQDERDWRLGNPRPVQYVEPDPESVESFHERKERQVEDLLRAIGADGMLAQRLRQDDAEYAETIHPMRAKATELARMKRDDLPASGLGL